jgi:predicted LPLAT superfamily acyltransferase/glycosyltransferase involved in cell wall biosynthesis
MILRICLCIPTYNNPLSIEKVVLDSLRETKFPVLIVDDGSSPSVTDVLITSETREALASGRLKILRHETNRGKGAALQTAIDHSVALGFTHLLSIDGDGQHYVSEASKLVQLATEYPWDVIVGNRQLKGATVPAASKFGRGFSNFWVHFQTGSEIADSQSGYRIYPLFLCQNLKFWTRRFDFEIEILIRLMWKGARVREVEIEVFYPEKGQRVSHFNKLWDNVRISCLNTVLVILTLLNSYRAPRKIGIAFGTGVFIGCTPFYGFHTVIVAIVSLFFRLNAGLLFLGSQIAIPPIAPFLIFASIWIGGKIRSLWSSAPASLAETFKPHSFHEFLLIGSQHLFEWLIGSVVLGATLGISSGILAYVVSRGMRRQKKPSWSGATRGGKFGNGFLKFILKHMNIHVGYLFLYFIIPYFYLFAPQARRSLNEYWRMVNPSLTWPGRQRRILQHLFRFGQVLMDRLAQSFSAEAEFKTNPHGIEIILEALGDGKALILLCAHVGGWDLAAPLLKKDGYGNELHTIEYQTNQLNFNDFKEKGSADHVKALASNTSEQPIFSIHDLLSRGKPIGIMGDRPLSDRFELVLFFGKLAPFDTTAFRVAAASRAPLLMTFGFKGKSQTYDFYALPARDYRYTTDQNRALQCQAWVQDYAFELEKMMRIYPEQWFNFFPLWSTVPQPPISAPTSGTGAKSPNYLKEELHKPTSPGAAPEFVARPSAAIES